jgi:hypothetical protein
MWISLKHISSLFNWTSSYFTCTWNLEFIKNGTLGPHIMYNLRIDSGCIKHRRGPGDFKWHSWWTKWHWSGFHSNLFSFLVVIIFPPPRHGVFNSSDLGTYRILGPKLVSSSLIQHLVGPGGKDILVVSPSRVYSLLKMYRSVEELLNYSSILVKVTIMTKCLLQ